jgi:hypothetical protein
MTMTRWILCAIVVAALPFQLDATSGCALQTGGIKLPPDQSHPNSYICSCNCTPESRHLEVRVTASSDDAEQTTVGIDLTSPVFHLMPPQVGGVRFQNVTVPMGAHVLDAHVEFTPLDSVNQVVTFKIVGEAADDAATFAETANNISGRPGTANSVAWSPPGWTAGGSAESTPDLSAIVQEIVDRSGWSSGNALVLKIPVTGGSGSRNAVSYDGAPFSAPLLVIDYEDPVSKVVGPQDLQVCVLPDLNPNLPGGVEPTVTQLSDDCTGRVEGTLSGLSSACGYPSNCGCSIKAESQSFSQTCNNTCVADPVTADCSNFDPVNGKVTATNAPGGESVCLVHSPLAFGIYGRRSTCDVSGTAHVEVQGDSADPSATGILQFRGTPCPGHACAVGMEYRLDVGSVTFGNVFGSATFTDLAGLGESRVGQDAMLSIDGVGSFSPGVCLLSARGRRGSEAQAVVATNSEAINVAVQFGSMAPMCGLHGAAVGSVDPELRRCESGGNVCRGDSDCADGDTCSEVGASDILLSLDVSGRIVNQPPTADAGPDQTIECPAPAVLDGSASSDLDSNITLFSWRRGSRTGPEVGFAEVSNVEQGLGTQTYVLRVIDAFAQTDEDTTAVTVVDTTPPVLSCSVMTPVLDQTNHNLVNVGLASRARDACEGELPVTLHVFSDEDDEMQTGDGNFSPDAKNIDVGTLRLRAERQGNGDGRVYLIVTEATDSSGNRGSSCCTVVVPGSHAPADLGSAQAQAAAAQALCLANGGMPPSGYFVVGDGPLIGPKQ